MKKFKGFKKLMIFGLAVATIFSMAGITSYATNVVQFGGKDVDLDSNSISISEADEKFVNDITTKEVHFTNSSKINLALSDSTIYGTVSNPIKKRYETKIKLDNAYNFAFEWNEQIRRTLEEKYTFINKVPTSINVPVPFFFSECEKDPDGWNFESARLEGYSNTKVNIPDLQSYFNDKALNDGYTFMSKEFAYTPEVGYINTEGTQKYTSNNGSWFFKAPMEVRYTVDIANVTAGGAPKLSGDKLNKKIEYKDIHETNKIYFRDGDINKDITNGYTKPSGITDSAIAQYKTGFGTDANAKTEDGYEVAYYKVTVHDPLTGVAGKEQITKNVPTTLDGQTEIRVAYGKKVEFTKVNDEGNPVIGKAAEFTIYADKDKKEIVGSVSSDLESGKVTTPALTLPEFNQPAKTYYVEETKAPDGYEKSDELFELTINSNGVVTYGNGFENGNIVNPEIKEPTIVKSSNPVSGEYVNNKQEINYILTVTNDSKNDRDILVKDELPEGVIFNSDKVYTVLDQNNNVVASGKEWNKQWEGSIKANSTLTFIIPVVVTKDFDKETPSNNVITNVGSLQTKKLTGNEYSEEQKTNEVTHYLTPKVSYTMEKARVTEPKNGLKGFIAGAGEVIDYKVTLKNTGNLDLDIDLNDVFEKSDYFTFVDGSVSKVALKVGETKKVMFKATVNSDTPEEVKKGYLNTVTSEGQAEYIDPKAYHESGNSEEPVIKKIIINKDTQKDLEKTSPAYTPVIEAGDPTIVKTSDIESQSFIKKGDKITYTLTVTNPYNVSRNILVTDVLPKQVEASDNYLINGKSQGKAWDGSYEGNIEANGELVFEIPVTVIDSFNNKDHDSNTILNQANLKAKDLLTNKYGNEIPTEEIIHYLEPAIGYTMTKERITNPDKGLTGFYAGTGQVIDYKVILVNIGDITLDIDLEDVFVNAEYFEFVDTNLASVTIEPGETREVIFKATIKAGTPAKADYENIVTSIAQGWYLNAKTGETVLVNQDNWPDAVTTAKIEDDAITPVITPEVKPVEPAKPGVATGDNSSIALFGSLAVISGLALLLKRKKEN